MGGLIQRIGYLLYRQTMAGEWLFLAKWRRLFFRMMHGRWYDGLFIWSHVYIESFRNLSLGKHVSINRGSNLSCIGGLTIGDYVAIGHECSIITSSHGHDLGAGPMKYQPLIMQPVVIGSDVWIGANVTILSGVRLADGVIVGAGAVVTKSFEEPGTIIGGVPAKVIGKRGLAA